MEVTEAALTAYTEPEQAERALIGRMILFDDTIPTARFYAAPDEFSDPIRAEAFRVLLEMHDAACIITTAAVGRVVHQRHSKRHYGELLAELVRCGAEAASQTNVEYYARAVAAHARLRRLKDEAEAIARAKAKSTAEVLSLFDRATRNAQVPDEAKPHVIGEVLQRAYDDLANPEDMAPRIEVGLRVIDSACGGMRSGELWIVAGRPGSGKSVLGWQIAEAAAKCGPVLFFSLEMSEEELAGRMFARSTSMTTADIRRQFVPDGAWPELRATCLRYADVPLHVVSSPRLSINELTMLAENVHKREQVIAVVVDYLQLVRCHLPGENRRDLVVGHITRELKALARTVRAPVVALCQINRESANRADNRPMLQDLRESGSIEQDADGVLATHRPFLFDSSKPEEDADIIVLKHRHGRLGAVPVRFNGAKSGFEDRI